MKLVVSALLSFEKFWNEDGMKISLSMWAPGLPSAFSLPRWLSLFLKPWLPGPGPPSFLTELGSTAPHVPGVAPHRADNPFPQPARLISSPALQFKVCHICMGVLWLLPHQAEPKSEGSTQLVLHAIVRGTCLRFLHLGSPRVGLENKNPSSRKLWPPRKLHSEQMPS